MNDLKTAKSNAFPRTSVIQLNPAYLTQSGSSTSSIGIFSIYDVISDFLIYDAITICQNVTFSVLSLFSP